MRITPVSSLVDSAPWFGPPLATLLRTYEDSLGRHRTRQSMLLLADPRGTMVEDTTLADAIEHAQWLAREPSWKSPALAVLQAGEGAFLITPAYHGSDAPIELDPKPVRILDLDAAGTSSPVHVSLLGNPDAPWLKALVTAQRVVEPEFS